MPIEDYYSIIRDEIKNYFVIQSKKPFWQEMLKGTLSDEVYTYWVKVAVPKDLRKELGFDLRTSLHTHELSEAQKLRDAGMKAHDNGDHAKSEELLGKALEMFKG